jgi:large subunit ribosomal protein L30
MAEKKKAPAAKKAAGKIKLRRIGSPIRREGDQLKTLLGLGLKRAHQVVELENTPSTQGMVRKVAHLVEVVD